MKKILSKNILLRFGVPTALLAVGVVALLQGDAPPSLAFQDIGLDRSLTATAGEPKLIDYLDLKTFNERMRSRLPRYRPFIKDAARKHGFDWCLIAAQAYRESHLDPLARGAFDAQGLMQIRPATARSFKLADPFDPVANIKAGVQYLRSLYDLYDGVPEDDRRLMALAAYNVGPGHVQDARRLASRMGLDPNRWESLATTLLLLRERRYYQDSEQGFCRGDITVAYVKHILIYYDILKRQELDAMTAHAASAAKEVFID
jgi:membrane-bound lytic murein transglycosylase F